METQTAYKTTPQSREHWLSDRQGKIGGSTISAILGLDDYRTPVDVWMDLTGKSGAKTENKATIRGQMMEQTVANFFEYETGRRIIARSADNEMYVHRDYPYLVASPDRRYWKETGDKAILECKTTRMVFDDIPNKWFVQLMWYLGLTSYGDGTIAWLHTTSEDFRYQDFEFKKDFFDYLINEAVQFWDKHVQGDTPPPITRAKDIDKLYRKHVGGKLVSIPESKIALYIKYGELQKQIKALTDQQEDIKDEIKLLVGDAEGVECDGKVLFTYKASADTTVFDDDTFKVQHPDLYNRFLVIRPGSRRFLRK